jgi:glycosyltransferase involved in cell wall biosynthesis
MGDRLRICHVSPHLPPDQGANALLPAQLGRWMSERGDAVVYVAHEAGQIRPKARGPGSKRQLGDPSHEDASDLARTGDGTGQRVPWSLGSGPDLNADVRWIPRRAPSGTMRRALKLDSLHVARCTNAALTKVAADADLLHLHSNGLIIEIAAAWARRRNVPYVLTLYGTEIWHYEPRRPIDPFTRAYQGAAHVTFYSQGLLDRARSEGLDRPGLTVIYPPVDEGFTSRDDAMRMRWRASLGIHEPKCNLNVKRLHELAGQRLLVEAFAQLSRGRADIRLVICGTGPLREALEQQIRSLGVADRVTLAGLVPHDLIARYMAAADVFALPSVLEALPTVAVEALASGTPVISADHPGGLELHGIFGEDVALVPRERAEPLAAALDTFFHHPRRTRPIAAQAIEEHFRPATVMAKYGAIYRDAVFHDRRGGL